MLSWERAEQCFAGMEAAAAEDALLSELMEEVVRSAVAYAQIRADWALNPPVMGDVDARDARGVHRTSVHNGLILACNMLARNARQRGKDASWREELGEDRRDIGDFACYLHAMLGIRAR